jgi:hypothetical protein
MALDSEARELIQRLQDIEDRLISDEIVEESVYNSIRTLERIFGKGSIYTELLQRLKSAHKVKRLDAAARRAIKQTETSIEVTNASAMFPHLEVNKNSFLTDYLTDKGRIPKAKLREFHQFFAKFGAKLEAAFEKGDAEEVKRILRSYIKILEDEEEFLRRNIDEITRDIKYSWSIHNIMGHEVAHWVWGELSKTRNIYAMALNEAYSFALQKLMHTFENDYTFTREGLLKEVRELYKLIVPRKYAYNELQYKFMRAFIISIGILILCDSIARKDGDFRNKKLFLQSYSEPTLLVVYQLIEQAISNLRNNEFQEVIRETLLKTGVSQLKKCKYEVIADFDDHLNKLPNFVKEEIIVFGGTNKRKKWDSFKSALGTDGGGVLNNNLRQFVGSLDLLRIMGYGNEAREYRDRYFALLKKTLDKVAKDTRDEESEIYKREQHAVDGIIAVLKEEEQDLLQILQGMKF